MCVHISPLPCVPYYCVYHNPLYIACVFMHIVPLKRLSLDRLCHVCMFRTLMQCFSKVCTACRHLLRASVEMSELPLFPSCEQILYETVPAFCAKIHCKGKADYWEPFTGQSSCQFSRMSQTSLIEDWCIYSISLC